MFLCHKCRQLYDAVAVTVSEGPCEVCGSDDVCGDFKRYRRKTDKELSHMIERLRAACEASWALGHKVYHQAATPDAPDWVATRKLLAEALGKSI